MSWNRSNIRKVSEHRPKHPYLVFNDLIPNELQTCHYIRFLAPNFEQISQVQLLEIVKLWLYKHKKVFEFLTGGTKRDNVIGCRSLRCILFVLKKGIILTKRQNGGK